MGKLSNIERAFLVAKRIHMNQLYDIYPYIYHPTQVFNIAKELGYDEAILISCILHDSMEDGNLSYNDIKKAFGKEVAEIVYAVTDELGRNRQEKKAKTYPKIKANWKATVVKVCDRIGNIQQSKEYNQNKFKMYKEEHELFCKELKNENDIETIRAWDKLTKTISEVIF